MFCGAVLGFDSDSGELGIYLAREVGLPAAEDVWIGVQRQAGSPFGYYDIMIECIIGCYAGTTSSTYRARPIMCRGHSLRSQSVGIGRPACSPRECGSQAVAAAAAPLTRWCSLWRACTWVVRPTAFPVSTRPQLAPEADPDS